MRLVSKYIIKFKQSRCKHVFIGIDMGHRDSSGYLDWACSKCGKIFVVEYGLQIMNYGKISGPWSERKPI